MSDLIKLLRGYRIDARYPEEVMRQAADEIERLREWQRRAVNLLPLVPRVSGSDLSCEVSLLMAIEKTAVQPSAAPDFCPRCGEDTELCLCDRLVGYPDPRDPTVKITNILITPDPTGDAP